MRFHRRSKTGRTPKPRVRMFHLSAHLVHDLNPSTGLRTVRISKGTTYVGTRNRADTKIDRQFRRARVRALRARQAMEAEMQREAA